MTNQPTYHPELQCAVHGLDYDFTTRTGTLHMANGHCCDMSGAIAMFERIDPAVETIRTNAGDVSDTAYRRRGDGWVAL